MTRCKALLAAAVVAAVVAVVPVADAQTTHVVGVGSSAQFLGTMIGMSQLAFNNKGGNCIYHWTQKNAMLAHDNRDSLNRILDETGNMGIVWIASCSDVTGNTGITDVWLDGQYDSTLGVRLFSAQQKAPNAGSGATIYLASSIIGGTASNNLVLPNNLWADNAADVAIPANMVSYIGNAVTASSLHVNMGLTDIRPEDALYATTRTKAALNTTTWAGLGYVGPTAQIGAPIYTAQSGSTSNFTPIGFALSGGKDPISGVTVPAYTTIPVGAAPIVFIYNNGGVFSNGLADLKTGVKGDGTANVAGSYKLANLFDGTSSCDTNNAAFTNGGDGLASAITIYLREPLSGTMNTTEFTTFRTAGNTKDSQEVGVINPTRAPYNPLNLNCIGNGHRERRIGNGQVVSAVNATLHGMGYMFFSFANSTSVIGSAANQGNYQYFTLDGVDPIGLATSNQELPFCSGTICPSSLWSHSISFPNLRNGTYKAWSLYRWTNYETNTDPLGPTGLATSMQDNINGTVADFVPFVTSTNSDGLEVYREHFTQSAKSCSYTGTTTCDGNATPTELLTDGNSLGGGPEQGGDEGGVIIGWDHSTVKTANQTTGACAGTTKVSKTAGRTFGFSAAQPGHTTGNPAALVGLTVTINNVNHVVSGCIAPTSAALYVPGSLGTQTNLPFSVYIAPTVTGALGKKQ